MKTSDPTPPPYVQIMTDIYAWKDLFFSLFFFLNMQEAAMHTTMCGQTKEHRKKRKIGEGQLSAFLKFSDAVDKAYML